MASNQYAVNEQGEKIIASSLRADGTVRKERRVRAGYVPREEVPVYVPRHIRERRAAAGGTESTTTSLPSVERRTGSMNSSVPGYSENPPHGGVSSRRAKGLEGIYPTQAPSAVSSQVLDSVEGAVDALHRLHIKETTTATCASKTRQIGEDSKKLSRGRGAGSFKYQPSSSSSAASTTSTAEHRASISTSNLSSNSNNQRARSPPLRPPIKSLPSTNEDEDDDAPPGFSNP